MKSRQRTLPGGHPQAERLARQDREYRAWALGHFVLGKALLAEHLETGRGRLPAAIREFRQAAELDVQLRADQIGHTFSAQTGRWVFQPVGLRETAADNYLEQYWLLRHAAPRQADEWFVAAADLFRAWRDERALSRLEEIREHPG